MPFLLAALAVAHLIALHVHGSNNPNGVTSNGDRIAMHPYFLFKDLVTIFAFFLVLSLIVFFYPNLLGQIMWPYIILLIVNIILKCAICWENILNFFKLKIVKIYNKTIDVSGLLIIKIFRKYIITKLNPVIVRYYYKIFNQQITKVIKNNYEFKCNKKRIFLIISLLWVGISETLRTKKNYNLNYLFPLFFLIFKKLSKMGDYSFGLGTYPICSSADYTFSYLSPRPRSLYFKSIYEINTIRIRGYNKDLNNIINSSNQIKVLCKTISTTSKKSISHLYSSFAIGQESRLILDLEGNLLNAKLKGIKIGKILDNHNNEISLEFRQWFAGLTDGDGYIYVNKEGRVGYELTLPSTDEKVLRIIQNKFGGNVHARGGYKAVRYRTENRFSIYKIIHCLNGLVINNIRLVQLHKACLALNIPIQDPISPDINSAYLSGLLDADGHINIYKSFYDITYRYQLTLTISNKSRCNIEFILKVIGGQIYFDKSLNGYYKWVANSKLLHKKLYDYFIKFPPKTIKSNRTFLIKEFHELNSLKAYLSIDKSSIKYKMWQNFLNRWDNKN